MMGELSVMGRFVSYCSGLDKRKCCGKIVGMFVAKDEPRLILLLPDGKFETKLLSLVTLMDTD